MCVTPFSLRNKSEIFQNSILNEPLGCMRPPPDIKPITELSIICFVHALGGNPMLPHIEIHCKTMCGTRASTWHKAEPGQGRGNRTEGPFSEKTLLAQKRARENLSEEMCLTEHPRRPKGKPLKKFLCGNKPFSVPGQFSPPKRETSERKPFWPKHAFSSVWKTVKFTKFELLWENVLGSQIQLSTMGGAHMALMLPSALALQLA